MIGNAAPVQLRKSNRIIVPFNRNNRENWVTHSDDDGLTWAAPRQVFGAAHKSWHWIGLGPPSSIQLESGRIVVPAYHAIDHGDGESSRGHTMLSDDGGESWRLGCEDFGGIHLSNECAPNAAASPYFMRPGLTLPHLCV